MLRNIIMFQVIQYLRDKTGLGWRGGCQGKMSYNPPGIVERNIRLAFLCMLWYDLRPTESVLMEFQRRFFKLEKPIYMTILLWSKANGITIYLLTQYCIVLKNNIPAVLYMYLCNFPVFKVKLLVSSSNRGTSDLGANNFLWKRLAV